MGHDDLHTFLSVAEIAGVLVGFVAPISFARDQALETRVELRGLVERRLPDGHLDRAHSDLSPSGKRCVAPQLAPAFYLTALALNLVEAAYLLARLVLARESNQGS